MTLRTDQHPSARLDEYVTIIAPSLAAVMGQFRARGLGALGFAITGPVARHRFAYATEGETHRQENQEMFGGEPMVAATFRRAGQEH